MKRLLFLLLGAALASLPAVSGLHGNPALSQRVPVRVPVGAHSVRFDQPGDDFDHGGRLPAAGSTSRATSEAAPREDESAQEGSRPTEVGEDDRPTPAPAASGRHAEEGHAAAPAARPQPGSAPTVRTHVEPGDAGQPAAVRRPASGEAEVDGAHGSKRH